MEWMLSIKSGLCLCRLSFGQFLFATHRASFNIITSRAMVVTIHWQRNSGQASAVNQPVDLEPPAEQQPAS